MPGKTQNTMVAETQVVTAENNAKQTTTQQGPSPVVTGTTVTQTKDYVVKSGDSLWKIAAKQLGNGSRFDEIQELVE